MKQEKWITGVLCILLIAGAGFLYLHTGQATSQNKATFTTTDTAVVSTDHSGASVDQTEPPIESKEYAVYICGAIKHPGVYRFSEAARVCDVIEAAGGLKKNAAASAINQARYITDGEQIEILTQKQWKKESSQTMEKETSSENSTSSSASSNLININQAAETELMTLSGIGQSKAKAIIDYRTQHGSFENIEDIMNVNGIKEGVYNQIKDFITV